jgi:DNA-binding transcriptional LysR family regulator
MQNRRIIDNITAAIGISINARIVTNSFLCICSHLRHGEWASIVPHSFFYALGAAADLVAIELVDPVHSQAIGLVFSDRTPASPMATALLLSAEHADIEAELAGTQRGV